jgi:hypothetical protein
MEKCIYEWIIGRKVSCGKNVEGDPQIRTVFSLKMLYVSAKRLHVSLKMLYVSAKILHGSAIPLRFKAVFSQFSAAFAHVSAVIILCILLLSSSRPELESNPANLQKYPDAVRDRAFEGSNHSVADTKESVFDERGFEFVFEGIGYYHLLRRVLARAKETPDVHNEIVWNGRRDAVKNNNFAPEKAGLLRIRESRILISGGLLIQNPGC